MNKLFTTIILTICNILVYGQILPPSFNTFDNTLDSIGWSHYSLNGTTDDWQLGSPSKYYFTSSYTSPNAWVTNLTGSYSANSYRALETPYYNLSDTSVHYVLSFKSKIKVNGTGICRLQYSDDNGSTWQLLDDAITKKQFWQTSSGFVFTNPYQWYKPAIDLFFLQGQDSIKFRFTFFTSGTANEAGWMIDDFSIAEPYFNVMAIKGDSIKGINKYFPNITVHSNFLFDNQWSNVNPPYSFNFQSDFYLSTDSIIDNTDISLGSVYNLLQNSLANWNNTFNLPPNIAAGTYYILYELDKQNILAEANENDNVSYAVLVVDSIFQVPYITNFDTTFQAWNASSNAASSSWIKGDPNNFYQEDPRSGMYCWISKLPPLSLDQYLESPYLDFSNSTNTVICLWHRNYGMHLKLQLPTYGNSTVSQPTYYQTTNTTILPTKRHRLWDCYCQDLSNYDGEQSTKLRFISRQNHFVIDDIYIGEARPDAAIEGFKINRFTNTSTSTDTLSYLFYNSGLENLISTTTEFYWSTDTILDTGDILLGTKIEPAMSDTTFTWQDFLYTKPTTTSGKYYIFYKIDATNSVTEMREYDNIGFFEIYLSPLESLPYFNDFETNVDNWRHNSTLGNDDWEWGNPQSSNYYTPIFGSKAFVTNDTGLVSVNSRMHLYSPQFNLTQLQNPVLEFDLLYSLAQGATGTDSKKANLLYSTNGGATWELLDTTNMSYKRFFYPIKYEIGIDKDYPNITIDSDFDHTTVYRSGDFIYSDRYQGRDYDDNYHFVIDLNFLQQCDNIQFAFGLGNWEVPIEGLVIDNFQIREAEIDLMKPNIKKMMVSSIDKRIKQNVIIKNNNNYMSVATNVNFYCSNDTLLDSSDVFIGTSDIRFLRPYEKCNINIDFPTPTNYNLYNYLILEIDPNNLNIESNENNNISFYELNMDTAANFSYPLLFDFNGDEIDGWTWNHDSAGFRDGFRFRHKTVAGETSINVNDGEWFLDNMYSLLHVDEIPNYFLESPSFNFSNFSNVYLEFDFLCLGKNTFLNGYDGSGGNMQYSIDGGQTWNILTNALDPSAQNWYNLSEMEYLSFEPGWGTFPNWSTAKYNLSFLAGNQFVRFRYKFRSIFSNNNYTNHGFRLDNFKLKVSETVELPAINICSGDSALIFGNFQQIQGIYTDTILNPNGIDLIYIQPLNTTIIDTSISSNNFTLTSNSNGSTYQWLNCESNYASILGETNQIFNPTSDGNYAVEITLNGCKDTSECYLIQGLGTFDNLTNNFGILIYPNPNIGLFTIEKTFEHQKNIQIMILDGASQLIFNTELKFNEPKAGIDITAFSAGIYYLKIIIDNQVFVNKIVRS